MFLGAWRSSSETVQQLSLWTYMASMTWPHVATRFEEILLSVVEESEQDRIQEGEAHAGLRGGERGRDAERLPYAS